ncbi:MAG: hypothetical protein JNG88_10440 [Phycisphaerales bacterium]|nr:hypothetical protein [Phycisphaerales bacterium]
MFSNWLFVRLRAAENALNEGRIDEAFAALREPDLRGHRRSQRLLDGLAASLLARARVHAHAAHWDEAVADLNRIHDIARGSPEVEELRRQVSDEMITRRARGAAHDQAIARAADHLRAGRLESGRAAIDQVDDARRREELRDELDIRMRRSDELLDRAEAALSDGDVLTAARIWHDARTRHGSTPRGDLFAGRISPRLRDELDANFREGRLERLLAGLHLASALREADPAMAEYERLGALLSRVAGDLSRSDYGLLREGLLQISARRSSARWVEETLRYVADVIAAREKLLASPIGLLTGRSAHDQTQAHAQRRESPRKPQNAPIPSPVANAESSALVLIDGTGSALLVRRDTLRIGRAGGGSEVDAPIPADLMSHHADIVRAGEDYFLVAYGPTLVNQREVRRALLRDGDRLTFGSRAARATFHKPSSKSESAVLRLADRCRLPQDVSSIVLFKDTCTVGPQPSCHIQTREGDSRVLIVQSGGGLHARRLSADNKPMDRSEPLLAGTPLMVGDQRITMNQYDWRDASPRA